MSKTHNLFISHSWEYSDAYEKFCNLLDDRSHFKYKNFSVPKNDPIHTNGTDKQLTEAIYNRIKNCHVIVIMGGVYSTYSKWINKEIEIANNHFSTPKPIIGVKPRRQTNLSKVVSENALEIVSWNTNSIVSAIRKHSNA